MMDFYIDPSLRHDSHSIRSSLNSSSALRILEEVLSPVRSRIPSLRDVIVIAVDTETMPHSTKIRELGIAVLDTRHLSREDTKIQTQMFLLGRSTRSRKAQKFWPHQCLFGTTEDVENTDIADLLRTILMPPSCHIILIGHSIGNDCYSIKSNYGIDLKKEPAVLAIIDTSRLASSVNNFVVKKVALYDTCLSCGIRPELLHNAGNDAVYTSRATLLLFKRYKEEKMFYTTLGLPENGDQTALLWEYQLERLSSIGRAHEKIVLQHLQHMQDDAEERRIMKQRRKIACNALQPE